MFSAVPVSVIVTPAPATRFLNVSTPSTALTNISVPGALGVAVTVVLLVFAVFTNACSIESNTNI